MGRYDFRALFDKEPAVIAGTIKSVLWIAVLFGFSIGEQQLAAVALGLEAILTLFVRGNSTSNATVAAMTGATSAQTASVPSGGVLVVDATETPNTE